MRFLLVPLDERPVSLRLPGLIAAIAGATVEIPPFAARPTIRKAGNLVALDDWLSDAAATADGIVVSLEGLGFGGLIPSRIGDESAASVLSRWEVLRAVACPVYASIVIPRTPDSLDAFEEPEYWAQWGPELHALSNRIDDDLVPLAALPDDVRQDWLQRRLRQHTLALGALGLVSDGTLERLFIGVDDSTPGSLSSVAQQDLAQWAARVDHETRIVVAPGADETAAVLVARMIVDALGAVRPRVAVVCAEPDGLDRIAPYETGPVGDTARAQLVSAGAIVVAEPDEADAVLIVHAPQSGSGDWAVSPPSRHDSAAAARTVALAAEYWSSGRAVAVADTAQPNGADPALTEALASAELLESLDGFAAWNTAGNTLGTVAAHLVTALAARQAGCFDAEAAAQHTRLRLLEDYGYMSGGRAALRRELGSPSDRHDHIEDERAAAAHVAASLTAAMAALPGGVAAIAAEDIAFPWGRSFEIALDDSAGEGR